MSSFDKSGSGVGSEIVWEPFGDGMVTITPAGSGHNVMVAASYIIIDGGPDMQIEFDGNGITPQCQPLYVSDWPGIGTNVTIRRCIIKRAVGPFSLTYTNNN